MVEGSLTHAGGKQGGHLGNLVKGAGVTRMGYCPQDQTFEMSFFFFFSKAFLPESI